MPTQRKIARYGYQRDSLDPRDRIYGLFDPILQDHQLPATYSLRSEMPPVYDQGQLGSCTANATVALFEHQAILQGEAAVTPSRLFVYYEERRIEGQPADQDTGAQVRDGIKVLASEGVPPESEWPYDISRFGEQPPQAAYRDATAHEAVAYKRIVIGGPGAPMRTAVYSHQPIAFGFPVPAYFESSTWDSRSEPLRLPDASTQIIGGHAVVVVGYDFSRSRFPVPVFEVRNSWGSDWGDQGYFWLDYRYFDPYRQLADDLWVVSKVK